uniref:1-Aminocyclopropane-1-carboxylate deaminase n=1 Tax=Alteromonadaceae bacterium PE-TB08W TaxID=1199097 RepID=A0A3G9ES23_9ALTE|nr:1-Aminocyclopropane-1-carboxylate deaminase [Alteromonadaceae bacterium PE-TB08W]
MDPQSETHSIQSLRAAIPREKVAEYPTPLIRADRLALELKAERFFFKRDDLISFGLGGNKTRGLEVILSDALRRKADTLVTGAGVLSNHVRTAAAFASAYGMDCEAVYWGSAPSSAIGNYAIVQMLGAKLNFTDELDRTSVDRHIDYVVQRLRDKGRKSYAIPRGGACGHGVLGHVLAVCELFQQCNELGIEPDRIVLGAGSGGTYAGWLLGIRLLDLPWLVEGFSVSRPREDMENQVLALISEAEAILGVKAQFRREDLQIRDGFIGEGYGIPSIEGNEAIQLVCKTEGVLLDPVYTGKAMAGFKSEIQTGKLSRSGTTVFIHTGGEPNYYSLSN